MHRRADLHQQGREDKKANEDAVRGLPLEPLYV